MTTTKEVQKASAAAEQAALTVDQARRRVGELDALVRSLEDQQRSKKGAIGGLVCAAADARRAPAEVEKHRKDYADTRAKLLSRVEAAEAAGKPASADDVSALKALDDLAGQREIEWRPLIARHAAELEAANDAVVAAERELATIEKNLAVAQLGLDEARKQVQSAERAALAATRGESVMKIHALGDQRLASARKVDGLMDMLAAELRRMEELGNEIDKLGKPFLIERNGRLATISRPLVLDQWHSRLRHVAVSRGLANYFEVGEGWYETKPRPSSLAVTEAAVHASYDPGDTAASDAPPPKAA